MWSDPPAGLSPSRPDLRQQGAWRNSSQFQVVTVPGSVLSPLPVVTTEEGTVTLQFSGEGRSHRSEWQGLGSGLESGVRGPASHSGLQLAPRCPGCVGRRCCTPGQACTSPLVCRQGPAGLGGRLQGDRQVGGAVFSLPVYIRHKFLLMALLNVERLPLDLKIDLATKQEKTVLWEGHMKGGVCSASCLNGCQAAATDVGRSRTGSSPQWAGTLT